MEHITGLLKIALLQSQFIFFSFRLSLFLPSKCSYLFPLFRTSLRREMSNGEKACQLIYQLAARVQFSVLSGLTGWGCGTMGLSQHPWLSVCYGPCYMAMKLWAQGENESVASVYGELKEPWTSPCGRARGLKSPGKAGIRRHSAIREYIMRWEWMITADEKSLRQMHV